MNPDLFIFDVEALDTRSRPYEEEFVVRHRIPFPPQTCLKTNAGASMAMARSSTATR